MFQKRPILQMKSEVFIQIQSLFPKILSHKSPLFQPSHQLYSLIHSNHDLSRVEFTFTYERTEPKLSVLSLYKSDAVPYIPLIIQDDHDLFNFQSASHDHFIMAVTP